MKQRVFGLLLLLACDLAAQNISATILGSVTDGSRRGIPGAVIELTGVVTRARTDRLGAYQVPSSPAC
jgi:hypothetical protein